jgi:hypothetical protein
VSRDTDLAGEAFHRPPRLEQAGEDIDKPNNLPLINQRSFQSHERGLWRGRGEPRHDGHHGNGEHDQTGDAA